MLIYFTDFSLVKRIALHIIFWLAYLSQDTLYAFFISGSRLDTLPTATRMGIALHVCAAFLLIKIIFTYLLLYGIIESIVKQKRSLIVNIFYLVAAVLTALLIYRAITIYYLYPIAYKGLLPEQDFWRPVSFFFGLIDLGFVAGSAIVIRQIRLQLIGREKERMLIKEKLETELKFLKNQTNPHFLFNTLNNIYALARKKSDITADAIMKLSKILRFMLYESGKESITIDQEIKLIEDYIELEKIRYSERLNISFKKNIDNISHPVSPLLLLPFVENAFKHGPSESFYDSFINIEITLQQGHLIFIIENTKEEEELTQPPDIKIGLGNIRRQLQLIYREYDMQVYNQPKTFKVELTVNLSENGKI